MRIFNHFQHHKELELMKKVLSSESNIPVTPDSGKKQRRGRGHRNAPGQSKELTTFQENRYSEVDNPRHRERTELDNLLFTHQSASKTERNLSTEIMSNGSVEDNKLNEIYMLAKQPSATLDHRKLSTPDLKSPEERLLRKEEPSISIIKDDQRSQISKVSRPEELRRQARSQNQRPQWS